MKQDFKYTLIEGAFAHMYATLTGGVFLTGFALYLGLSDLMIGLLGAMPFLVTLFQIPATFLIGRYGWRKRIALLSAGAARILWLPIVLAALFPLWGPAATAALILGMVFLSHAFGSVSYVSWLSWISDLVPEGIRGRFFGARNMLCGAAGIVALLLFGEILDRMNSSSDGSLPLGFMITFISAVALGMMSLVFLLRIADPPRIQSQKGPGAEKTSLLLPLKESNFRRFLCYAFLWGFGVYFAGPFFTLYFLRDLRFSYAFVSALAMLSSLADLTGMVVWGKISDRIRNRAVIAMASWAAVFLPLAWAMVRPGDVLGPVLLHVLGGALWAGINLCTNNLLLGLSPNGARTWHLSLYHVTAGLGATLGPIAGGLLLRHVPSSGIALLSWTLQPLQAIFLISTALRLLGLFMFRYVREPQETSVGQAVRILRGVRGLNVASGFAMLLHPFLELDKTRARRE